MGSKLELMIVDIQNLTPRRKRRRRRIRKTVISLMNRLQIQKTALNPIVLSIPPKNTLQAMLPTVISSLKMGQIQTKVKLQHPMLKRRIRVDGQVQLLVAGL